MAHVPQDTIFALATPPGRSGVAVLRLSGPRAIDVVERLAGRSFQPRQATLAALKEPERGEQLDKAIVITFPRPASFTGEDVAEIQCHGSRAVVRAFLNLLEKIDKVRIAEPGEFTRRALANGRLDLTQVEALADLLQAETESQRLLAQRALDGAVTRKVDGWRDDLVHALALVEATIDFADEELPVEIVDVLRKKLIAISAAFTAEIAGASLAERVRDGFEVALVGRPNAGKSTLLNALAGREAALTSAQAGTTRDVLEVRMDLDGLAVTVLDMAGLRETTEEVEALGIARAKTRAGSADVRIFLLEGPEDPGTLGVTWRDGDLVALGKADLLECGAAPFGAIPVSGRTGDGIDTLVAALAETLMARAASAGQISNSRQRVALVRAQTGLQAAASALLQGDGEIDLVAMNIRSALQALEYLVGRVDVESVLDVIFSSFCLGK